MTAVEAAPVRAARPLEGPSATQPWWKVMCLTGVDYFSTLGYQPGIAALAAGALAPIATLILVLLTLFGALPIYRRVAQESPHGQGSISMLERLLSWWQGKLFVLVLLGFVATDFVITITLSAADATAHVIENPIFPDAWHGSAAQIGITLFLIALLGAVFLKGFREAIGIAVWLVIAYLGLNVIVVGAGLVHVFAHPIVINDWRQVLFAQHGNLSWPRSLSMGVTRLAHRRGGGRSGRGWLARSRLPTCKLQHPRCPRGSVASSLDVAGRN